MSGAAIALVVVVLVLFMGGGFLFYRSRKVGPAQVYLYDVGRYGVTSASEARSVAGKLGGTLATITQLQDAMSRGFQHNYYAWVDDSAEYTAGSPGAQLYIPSGAEKTTNFPGIVGPQAAAGGGVLVYGPKPSKYKFDFLGRKCFKGGAHVATGTQACVFPFSSEAWDDPTPPL